MIIEVRGVKIQTREKTKAFRLPSSSRVPEERGPGERRGPSSGSEGYMK